jgi:hypothetical protein
MSTVSVRLKVYGTNPTRSSLGGGGCYGPFMSCLITNVSDPFVPPKRDDTKNSCLGQPTGAFQVGNIFGLISTQLKSGKPHLPW